MNEQCILLNGLFVTFEGGEGGGKSTLVKRLKATLEKEGFPVIDTREPGGCELGDVIRSILLDPELKGKIQDRAELFLFLAARAQHVEEKIRKALSERFIVLCDRFNDSTIVYQGFARGLGVEYVEQLCELSCYGVKPDLTFLVDVPPDMGLERARRVSEEKGDRIEEEEYEFHNKVREGFFLRAKSEPDRFHILDGTAHPEFVYETALETLRGILNPTHE
jgi:dTMP kinase